MLVADEDKETVFKVMHEVFREHTGIRPELTHIGPCSSLCLDMRANLRVYDSVYRGLWGASEFCI